MVSIIVIHINNIKIQFSKLLYTLSFAFMLSCYLVTPLINKAKDNSHMKIMEYTTYINNFINPNNTNNEFNYRV